MLAGAEVTNFHPLVLVRGGVGVRGKVGSPADKNPPRVEGTMLYR